MSLATSIADAFTAVGNDIQTLNGRGNPSDFGIGRTGVQELITDLDALDQPTGMFRVHSTNTTGTFPSGTSAFGTVLVTRYDANNVRQFYQPFNDNTIFQRRTDGGVWTAWVKEVDSTDLADFVTSGEIANFVTDTELNSVGLLTTSGPNTTNLDTLTTPGNYSTTTSDSAVGAPAGLNGTSAISVFPAQNGNNTIQTVTNLPTNRRFWRARAGSTWGSWSEVATKADIDAITAGSTPEEFGIGVFGTQVTLANLDDTNATTGLYRCAGSTTGTRPASADLGYVVVERYNASYLGQTFKAVSSDEMWTRRCNSNVWSPWVKIVSLENAPFVTPQMFGAVGNGVANDATPLRDARAHAVANGTGLMLPGGSYKDGTVVYEHKGPRMWLPGSDIIDATFAYWTKVEQSLHITGNRDASEDRDVVMVKFDLESDGPKHASVMRLQHTNHAAGQGGNTGIYARVDNGPSAGWCPVYHAESHRVGGSVFGLNVETKNYYTDSSNTTKDDTGEQMGVNIKMSTGTLLAHNKTSDQGGGGLVGFATPKGMQIMGTVGETYSNLGTAKDGTTVGEEGGWEYGIVIQEHAMRRSSAFSTGFRHEGYGAMGVDLRGNYTLAALRITSGEKIMFNNAIKSYIKSDADGIIFGSGTYGEQVEIITGVGPGIFVAGQRVLKERQPGIPNLLDATNGVGGGTLGSSGTAVIDNNFRKLNDKLIEALGALRAHGLIA